MFRRPDSDSDDLYEDDFYSFSGPRDRSPKVKPDAGDAGQSSRMEETSDSHAECGPSMSHALATDILEANSLRSSTGFLVRFHPLFLFLISNFFFFIRNRTFVCNRCLISISNEKNRPRKLQCLCL